MPIIPCPDCGREISDKATNCPGCGARTEHGRIFLGRIVAAFVVAALIAFGAWRIHEGEKAHRQLMQDAREATEALERLHD